MSFRPGNCTISSPPRTAPLLLLFTSPGRCRCRCRFGGRFVGRTPIKTPRSVSKQITESNCSSGRQREFRGNDGTAPSMPVTVWFPTFQCGNATQRLGRNRARVAHACRYTAVLPTIFIPASNAGFIGGLPPGPPTPPLPAISRPGIGCIGATRPLPMVPQLAALRTTR